MAMPIIYLLMQYLSQYYLVHCDIFNAGAIQIVCIIMMERLKVNSGLD